MNIMIIKCSGTKFWYNENSPTNPNRIRYYGCVFPVLGEERAFYKIDARGTHPHANSIQNPNSEIIFDNLLVLKSDCEIVENVKPTFIREFENG